MVGDVNMDAVFTQSLPVGSRMLDRSRLMVGFISTKSFRGGQQLLLYIRAYFFFRVVVREGRARSRGPEETCTAGLPRSPLRSSNVMGIVHYLDRGGRA